MPKRKLAIFTAMALGVFACTQKIVRTPTVLKSEEKIQEPIVASIGKTNITKSEVIKSIQNLTSLDSSSTHEIVSEYIQRQLFIAEARAKGYDTTQNFREQLRSHIQMALKNYTEDPNLIALLGDEAYNRYQKEINASHIYIPVSEFAHPNDTLKIYNELLKIRELAIKNNDFGTQAQKWSKDPKTAPKGGDLGWFTVFHLYYPLETAVYKTPKDSISMPIRSKAGYHIIKVNDTRKNSGTVRVRHIAKYLPPTSLPDEVAQMYNHLDSIRTAILQGEKFETMVERYSDDISSRDKNGELPSFGIGGRTERVFEDAAFSLQTDEISKPIQTSFGLHLIQLIEKQKPLNKTQFLQENEAKFTTDSRGEFITSKRIEAIKKQFKTLINPVALDNALKYASVRILNRNWEKPNTVLLSDNILTIEDQKYSINDFYDFVVDKQEYERFISQNPSEIFRSLFERFVQQKLIAYQEEHLLTTHPEVKEWSKAQEENILFSDFYDRNVILPSLRDTLGLKNYFEKNRNQFSPNEVGQMTVVSFSSSEVQQLYKELAAGPKPYRLFRGIQPLMYEANAYELNDADKRSLLALIQIMDNNPDYIVEIAGHQDSKEDDNVAELRIKEVVNYLVKNGLPLKRILEVNHKSSVIRDRFDWSKNQAVAFQFFSNAVTDLAKPINSKYPDGVIVNTFTIGRKEFESKMGTSWGNKSGTLEVDGKIEEYTLRIKKIKGTYKDYYSDVIRKYQESIANDLVKQLTYKHNLNYNTAELNTIINDLKKNN